MKRTLKCAIAMAGAAALMAGAAVPAGAVCVKTQTKAPSYSCGDVNSIIRGLDIQSILEKGCGSDCIKDISSYLPSCGNYGGNYGGNSCGNNSNTGNSGGNNSCSGNSCGSNSSSGNSGSNNSCSGDSCGNNSNSGNSGSNNSCSGNSCGSTSNTGNSGSNNSCSGDSCGNNSDGNTGSSNSASTQNPTWGNSFDFNKFLEYVTGSWGAGTNSGSNVTKPDTNTAKPDTNTTKPDTNTAKPDTNVTKPDADSTVSEYEKEVVRLVNEIRVENGLSELTINTELSAVARLKSQDMKDKGYFSHTSPTYGSPFDMMKSFGITYKTAGENIAMGYKTPEAVVDGWMNSKGHRENILKASYKEIGVGYVSSGNYWTQMFTG